MASVSHAARQRGEAAAAFMRLGAYERHRRLVSAAARYGSGPVPEALPPAAPTRTDADILQGAFRFIRSDAEDAVGDAWEVGLARRYYARLYREFALADLSRYREGRLGLRWRTQQEVVAGQGQFSCGALGCQERRGLSTFEVPFGYEEAGRRRAALVKLRLCPVHSRQLNHRKHREAEREARRAAKRERKGKKRKLREDGTEGRRSPCPAPGGEQEDEFKVFLDELLPP